MPSAVDLVRRCILDSLDDEDRMVVEGLCNAHDHWLAELNKRDAELKDLRTKFSGLKDALVRAELHLRDCSRMWMGCGDGHEAAQADYYAEQAKEALNTCGKTDE